MEVRDDDEVWKMKEIQEFREERLRIQNGGLLRGYDTGRDGREGLNLLFMLLGTSKRKLKLIKMRTGPNLSPSLDILYQPR